MNKNTTSYWPEINRNINFTSTSHYLVFLIDSIGKILEKPNCWPTLISIELQKAFDNVNHNILVGKLVTDFDIDSFLVKLVAPFLSNWSMVVKYQNNYSIPIPVHDGVAQGTLLGHILFSIMIHSLAKEFPDRWKFVDDLGVIKTCYRSLVANPMNILNDIADDAVGLDMRANFWKCIIMSICFLETSTLFLNLIPPDICVLSFKLVGVTISSNLEWDIFQVDVSMALGINQVTYSNRKFCRSVGLSVCLSVLVLLL